MSFGKPSFASVPRAVIESGTANQRGEAVAPCVVWIAGTNWDSVPGTDRRMVEALSESVDVLWVDPPIGWRPSHRIRSSPADMSRVARGVTRLTVTTLPGVTRPLARDFTSWLLGDQIRRALGSLGIRPTATVVAFPLARFPARVSGTRVLYVTDDWISGASLMGFSSSLMASSVAANVADADVVAAVSPLLLEELLRLGRPRTDTHLVLPNGGPQPVRLFPSSPRERVVGLAGTLNERLDLAMLEAVRDTGVMLRVIGPRVLGSKAFERRLDNLLASPNVQWIGAVSGSAIQGHLARLAVGVTPYTDSKFNRASFPLKTLEYLAAGVPVVSTDLPSARWLSTEHISLCSTPSDFAEAVLEALEAEQSAEAENARRDFALGHTWESRADILLQKLGVSQPNPANPTLNNRTERS